MIQKLMMVFVIVTVASVVEAMSFGSKGELVCDFDVQISDYKVYDYYLQYGYAKTEALIKKFELVDSLKSFDAFRKSPSYKYAEVVFGRTARLSSGFLPSEFRNGEKYLSHNYKLIPVEDVPLGFSPKVKIIGDQIMSDEVVCVDVWTDAETYLYATELMDDYYYYDRESVDLFWPGGRTDITRRWIVLGGMKERVYGYGTFRVAIEGTDIVSDKIYLKRSVSDFEDFRYTTKAAFRGVMVEQPDCWFNYHGSMEYGWDWCSWCFCYWDDNIKQLFKQYG